MPSREPELYKDKVEVSLDGRQIFYLFFGGAVVVGMVFVLGVLVGRRVEARGHIDRAQTQAETDPLAALDRLERSDHLSFQGALRGSEVSTEVEKAIGELEKRRIAKKPETDKKPEADRKPEADKAEEPIAHPEPDKPRADKRGETATAEKKKKHEEETRAESKPDSKDAKDRADGRRPEAKSEKSAKPDPDAKPSSESKGRFTLQLSSFQDKSEAESFLGTIKSAGYQPYLVEADVAGKGTFYRVRLGSYRSLDAANDAKAEYEKAAKKTAQVMHL